MGVKPLRPYSTVGRNLIVEKILWYINKKK